MHEMPDVDPIYHKKLFHITSKLRRAVTDPRNLTVEEYTSMLRELCGALTKSIDGDLAGIFRAAAGLTNMPGIQIEAQAVLHEAKAFAKFIEFERESLIRCGVGEAVAGQITDQVAGLREHLSSVEIDPEKTMVAVKRFRDDVCAAAQHANADLTMKEKRHRIKVGSTMASGVALSVANAAAITASAGALTPFVVLSTASGAAIITGAGFFNRPPGGRKLK